MPDYNKAKIYRIWSPETEKCYVGSTCDDLAERFKQHCRNAKYTYTTNCRSKELINHYNDVDIELLEDYPCSNLAELVLREGEWIGMYPTALNKCRNVKQSKHYKQVRDDPVKYAEHKVEALARYYKRLRRTCPEHYERSVKKLKLKGRTDILSILERT